MATLDTGRGELLSLKWDDVDLTEGTLRVKVFRLFANVDEDEASVCLAALVASLILKRKVPGRIIMQTKSGSSLLFICHNDCFLQTGQFLAAKRNLSKGSHILTFDRTCKVKCAIKIGASKR